MMMMIVLFANTLGHTYLCGLAALMLLQQFKLFYGYFDSGVTESSSLYLLTLVMLSQGAVAP